MRDPSGPPLLCFNPSFYKYVPLRVLRCLRRFTMVSSSNHTREPGIDTSIPNPRHPIRCGPNTVAEMTVQLTGMPFLTSMYAPWAPIRCRSVYQSILGHVLGEGISTAGRTKSARGRTYLTYGPWKQNQPNLDRRQLIMFLSRSKSTLCHIADSISRGIDEARRALAVSRSSSGQNVRRILPSGNNDLQS